MSTPLEDSLESHLMAFAAERSRAKDKIVYIRPLKHYLGL